MILTTYNILLIIICVIIIHLKKSYTYLNVELNKKLCDAILLGLLIILIIEIFGFIIKLIFY